MTDETRTETPFRQKLAGTNLEFAHVLNQRVVLETVRLRGPLSRPEISSFTSLTNQTILNIVDKLLERGLLETVGRRSGQRGQPALEVNINPKGGYAVGFHLDRDHLTGVLLDLAGTALQDAHREWSFPSPEEALPQLAEITRQLVREQGLRPADLWGVGIGLPGPLDVHAGAPMAPPNFPGWDGVPLRRLLSEQLGGVPVFLETDATAAAMGERWFGQGRDLSDYFYVFFGIGIGGGMILNGQPYRGAFDNSAMFGHLPVGSSRERCPCGGLGCLELTVSLSSLFAALGRDGAQTDLLGLETLLHENDPALLGWLEGAADSLAVGLITVEHLLSPQAILFGGRLPGPLQTWLIARLEQLLPERRMRALSRHPRLLQASAIGSAAALGAATLPLFHEFAPG